MLDGQEHTLQTLQSQVRLYHRHYAFLCIARKLCMGILPFLARSNLEIKSTNRSGGFEKPQIMHKWQQTIMRSTTVSVPQSAV